jgi:PLP dependent protein
LTSYRHVIGIWEARQYERDRCKSRRRACPHRGSLPRRGTTIGLGQAARRQQDLRRRRRARGRARRPTCICESYVQEALAKQAKLGDLSLEWHFIGPIQSNKTRGIAEAFDWAHGVDSLKIAQRLSSQRPDRLPPLNICVQVNISGEASKSGCRPDEAPALCRAIAALPRLRLRGLMAIPAPAADGADTRAAFRQLREIFTAARTDNVALDTISAGMSDDLEAAIMEGSTIVRVGSAIFGVRNRP